MEKVLNLPRESTMQRIAAALEHQSAMVEILAQDSLISVTSNWHEIQHLVREGLAPSVFSVGDQFIVEWKDVAANQTYSCALDIVHFGPVTLKDGEVVPGMFLQWHWSTPFAVQFNNYHPFYYCEEELPAGTYNVKFASAWSKMAKDTVVSFTLTQNVPAGGMLEGFERMADVESGTMLARSYASSKAETPIETVGITIGESGTRLAELNTTSGNTNLFNHMHTVGYGYNRWSQSAYRQWLNSDKAVGQWWEPTHIGDLRPNELFTKAGFLSGFSEDFLNVIGEVEIKTAANTVTDGGVTDITYDKFFLPSLEEEYCAPQLSGVEGEPWEYWKRALGLTTPQGSGAANANPNHIRYAINGKTSAQNVRLRSAYRGHASYVWSVYSTGYVYSGHAYYANRCAPACVIC